ncbi:restriction endonuclease subunit S [Staphylococcus xylosus]|uniref:restriction endonuclease subunit S n=2 Tax=Staphylococcus TaxID=1279 RepID=UPI002DBA8EDD|nr:restriction endonuclease subunit S [Staphylococcus xylosus]MEB7838251.1 restriction endonuclease subunit S [Staphylococcus xylosus]
MTNEVKIVPKLRFPGFESNWKEEKIKTLFKVVSGTTPLRSKKEYFDKAEVPWVKTTDLNNNVLRITDEKISNIAVKEVNMRILPENTLLIAMYGGFNQIGRTGIISFKSTINQAISALLDIEGKSDVNYLQAYFNYNVQKWKRLAASSRKDPNITKKDVENFKITIPTLKEQKRMGEFFSKLDRQIELEEQKLEKLEEQKKGYMQKVFSQELRFKDENGNEYPEWEDKKLLNVIAIQNGYAFKSNLFSEKGMPIIRITDINKSTVKKGTVYYPESIEINERFKIKQYDILIAMSGATTGKVGKYISEKPSLLNQRIGKFVMKKGTDNNFMFIYLNSLYFKKELSKLLVAGAQPNISSQDIENINLFIPINEEQRKIGEFFNELDELIEKQSSKIGVLKQRKKGFLQKMFV